MPRGHLNFENYDIDGATGFFPPQPLKPLEGAFGLWEKVLKEAEGNVSLGSDNRPEAKAKRARSEAWRAQVRSLPDLDIRCLGNDERAWQRAHMTLAFLVHFYVHSQPPKSQPGPVIVPKCLAVPLVAVSRLLGTAPVLTFADVVLWNWTPVDPRLPISANNYRCTHTLSGTQAEVEFYRLSAKVEIRGVEMLRIIDRYVHLEDKTNVTAITRLARDLERLGGITQEMTDIMASAKQTVDPYTFYWHVRPWWNGSTSSGTNVTGWVYEGVPDTANLHLDGPSAGQSTVMHALDAFLDVDHTATKKRYPPPSVDNKKADTGFMERMRQYMAGKHRAYLLDLSSIPTPVRELAKENAVLRDAFNAATLSLKKLRDIHIQIATYYIISMSRTTPPEGQEPTSSKPRQERAKGTGGTDLASLLKAGRDATNRTMLSGPPGPSA